VEGVRRGNGGGEESIDKNSCGLSVAVASLATVKTTCHPSSTCVEEKKKSSDSYSYGVLVEFHLQLVLLQNTNLTYITINVTSSHKVFRFLSKLPLKLFYLTKNHNFRSTPLPISQQLGVAIR